MFGRVSSLRMTSPATAALLAVVAAGVASGGQPPPIPGVPAPVFRETRGDPVAAVLRTQEQTANIERLPRVDQVSANLDGALELLVRA